jgi:hypothetical protein
MCTVVHTLFQMRYEWDPAKARANAKKHGVRLADAVTSLEDDRAVTIEDPDSEGEQRFVSLGTGCEWSGACHRFRVAR